MDQILGNIYCWFESLFGQNMGEYLWGYNCDSQDYSNPNLFNTIGLIAAGIALAVVLIYYYVINHPRFNRWWSWLIMLGVTGLINLFIGYAWTTTDLQNGKIADCLMYARDENGDIISTLIYQADCWMFGIANMIMAFMFFIVFSFLFKWWSVNCKHSPFI